MTTKEIGKKAELTVRKKIERTLRNYNDEYEIFDNLIVPFSSLYGSDLNMTTEIDILVLTRYFLFVFEVKSISSFKYRTNKFFKTGKTYIINPEKQNQTHRYALSEYLNIDCKNIVQIETLKKIPSKSEIENVVYTTVDNDYKLIYTQRNFSNELLNILNNTQKIDYDYYSVKTKLKELKENEANSLEKHIKNIEDMRIKRDLLNKQAKYYDISDSGLCPYCRQQSIKIQLKENKLVYICKNINCEKHNQTIEKVEASKLLINNNKKNTQKLKNKDIYNRRANS